MAKTEAEGGLRPRSPRKPKPSARLLLLQQIVDTAERKVRRLKDPGLRLAAFEKILGILLDEAFPPKGNAP